MRSGSMKHSPVSVTSSVPASSPTKWCCALALFAAACTSHAPEQPAKVSARIAWEPWSDAAFARARAEHKLVLLDLQAVWCHWCHVMDEQTYADPTVAQLLAQSFVTIQVDQDARPDISIRYEDWGWPATILFDSEGREIVKRAGFIPPDQMQSLLRATIADPTPGPSVVPPRAIEYSRSSALAEDVEKELNAEVVSRYDDEHGGYGRAQKFVDAASVEWLLSRARAGDAASEHMARQTLDAGLALIDPAWGGVYQYSTGGVWTEPHFEKIMSFQADDMRVYALASAQFGEPKYARAAQSISKYLRDFLTRPDGAFFTSQDADLVDGEHSGEYFALDDKARRARGIPRIDRHVYARENGWAIAASCALSNYTGDKDALGSARRAAEWVLANRAMEGGGFRHDDHDVAGPYLGDTLAMGEAFVALYASTGERAWLLHAVDAGHFIAQTFHAPTGRAGFRSTVASAQEDARDVVVQRDQNVACARFANELVQYAGGDEPAAMRDEALRFLATREIALDGMPGGVLLAVDESRRDPLHVTVVGPKNDVVSQALFDAARAIPEEWKRIEWFDSSEGTLPNDDVQFPDSLGRAAAFLCANGRCSSPAFSPAELAERLKRSRAR